MGLNFSMVYWEKFRYVKGWEGLYIEGVVGVSKGIFIRKVRIWLDVDFEDVELWGVE